MAQLHFNIYDEVRIDEWINMMMRDVSEPHIITWFKTIFRRWARQQTPMMRLAVPDGYYRSPVLHNGEVIAPDAKFTESQRTRAFAKFDRATFTPVDVTTIPERWALLALLKGELYFFEPSVRVTREVPHWVDFMRTLPNRAIRYTVDDLRAAVSRWDVQMARKKLLHDSTAGVEEVWSHGDHYVVRINSAEALKAEGELLSHCIWTSRYDLKLGSYLFSLRKRGQQVPLATMEVIEKQAPILLDAVQNMVRPTVGEWAAVRIIPDQPVDPLDLVTEGEPDLGATARRVQELYRRISPDTKDVSSMHGPWAKPYLNQVAVKSNRPVPAAVLEIAHHWFSECYPTCELSNKVVTEAQIAYEGVNLETVETTLGEHLAQAMRDVMGQPGPMRQMLLASRQQGRTIRRLGLPDIPQVEIEVPHGHMPGIELSSRDTTEHMNRMARALGIPAGFVHGELTLSQGYNLSRGLDIDQQIDILPGGNENGNADSDR